MKRSNFAFRRARLRACCAIVLAVIPAGALLWVGAGAAAPAGTADLRIAKSDSPDPVNVGSRLTYTILVDNLGPDPAIDVVVTDRLPKGVDFASASATSGKCTRKGQRVTCKVGDLSAPGGVDYGGSPTVSIAVIPREVGTISNTASVKGDQSDPVGSNDRATATTTVLGPPVTCRGVAATIVGTAGADNLVGTGGRDVIVALDGDDAIASLAGRDLICAGDGDDSVGGGSAADRVLGGRGRDRLRGRGGPDALKGNGGNDVLSGNRGADRLRGGRGVDRCQGGPGVDSIRGCEL